MQNSTTRTNLLTPTTFAEAIKYSELIANSSFCPPQFKGKANDVLIAIQMGNEIGLQPIQALQNISVINGRPTVWGDAALALVMSHSSFEWIKETIEDNAAHCVIKRKGMEPHTSIFDLNDAKKANLLGRSGPWTTYPKRMLQMRARGFALRDTFPDALKGIIIREEAEDYVEKDVTPAVNKSTYIDNYPYDQVERTTNLDSMGQKVDESLGPLIPTDNKIYSMMASDEISGEIKKSFDTISAIFDNFMKDVEDITTLEDLQNWKDCIRDLDINLEQKTQANQAYLSASKRIKGEK